MEAILLEKLSKFFHDAVKPVLNLHLLLSVQSGAPSTDQLEDIKSLIHDQHTKLNDIFSMQNIENKMLLSNVFEHFETQYAEIFSMLDNQVFDQKRLVEIKSKNRKLTAETLKKIKFKMVE